MFTKAPKSIKAIKSNQPNKAKIYTSGFGLQPAHDIAMSLCADGSLTYSSRRLELEKFEQSRRLEISENQINELSNNVINLEQNMTLNIYVSDDVFKKSNVIGVYNRKQVFLPTQSIFNHKEVIDDIAMVYVDSVRVKQGYLNLNCHNVELHKGIPVPNSNYEKHPVKAFRLDVVVQYQIKDNQLFAYIS